MISVIIPTYNRENSILDSVNSVLQQTYTDLELIIVDDGSQDQTIQVLSSIKDSRLRIEILPQNSGACVARNVGVEISRGEYIAFNDSDDIWHPDKLEKQLAFLLENNADVVASNFEYVNRGERYKLIDDRNKKNTLVNIADLVPYNFISTQTILGKHEVFKRIPFKADMPRLQDWLLMLEITRRYKVCFDHSCLVSVGTEQENRISHNMEKLQAGMKIAVDWLMGEYGRNPDDHEMQEVVNKLSENYALLIVQRANLEAEKATLEAEKATLEAEKATLEAEKATLEAKKEILETEKATLETEKAKLETEKTNLKAEMAVMSNELNLMIHSRSWRITKPLRLLKRVLSRRTKVEK